MIMPVLDNQNVCSHCDADHKLEKLKTFRGAYGVYCIPTNHHKSVTEKIKQNHRFREYLGINDVHPNDRLVRKAWLRAHRRHDADPLNTTCFHAVSGGCKRCYRNAYYGPEGAAK